VPTLLAGALADLGDGLLPAASEDERGRGRGRSPAAPSSRAHGGRSIIGWLEASARVSSPGPGGQPLKPLPRPVLCGSPPRGGESARCPPRSARPGSGLPPSPTWAFSLPWRARPTPTMRAGQLLLSPLPLSSLWQHRREKASHVLSCSFSRSSNFF
jgi:hypothetical protein